MNPADIARQNAIPLEVKKDGLQQRQNGDWVLRFVVQAADMDQRLTSAAMGTRFQVALVEIGDDELPKQKDKMEWRELQPAAQAGMRCEDPVFLKFLDEKHTVTFRRYMRDAAGTVRFICGVSSRSELGTKQAARMIWKQLDDQFQAWQRIGA